MNKSILILEAPENCYDCRIRRGYTCGGVGEIYGETLPSNLAKPKWCPLKEMPSKMEVGIEFQRIDEIVPSYKIGFNSCIEEILKEKS